MAALPPMEHIVKKLKMSALSVRHLNGGVPYVRFGTNNGANLHEYVQLGSFMNSNDKCHNHTLHRHDPSKLRNISTSFDPASFICKPCTDEHCVLHRTMSARQTPQSFPPNGPGGGGGGW